MFREYSVELVAATAIAAASFSTDGWAIVSENAVIQAVNEQFCKICQVTPAMILDKTFMEITSQKDLYEDVENARLVAAGKSAGYYMEKTYDFKTHQVEVGLTVVGVFLEGKFQYYLSRIQEIVNIEKLGEQPLSTPLSPVEISKKPKWFANNEDKLYAALGTGAAAFIIYLINEMIKD